MYHSLSQRRSGLLAVGSEALESLLSDFLPPNRPITRCLFDPLRDDPRFGALVESGSTQPRTRALETPPIPATALTAGR